MVTKQFLAHIQYDVRSVTGRNLRSILLLTDKCKVKDITIHDVNSIRYHPVTDNNIWRVNFVQELVNIRHGQQSVEWFKIEELNEILRHICVNQVIN